MTVILRDGTQLKAASFILKVCSPVFREALNLKGPWTEARELRIEMDAYAEAAKELLRFLYTGRFCSDAPSLELVVDLLRLADYYDVKDQFVKAAEDFVSTTAGAMDDPSILVVKLRPFLTESQQMQQLLFGKLKLALGRNVYKCLCHAIAYDLKELTERCQQAEVLKPFALDKEINELVVREVLHLHGGDITSQALKHFIDICKKQPKKAIQVGGDPRPGDRVQLAGHSLSMTYLVRDTSVDRKSNPHRYIPGCLYEVYVEDGKLPLGFSMYMSDKVQRILKKKILSSQHVQSLQSLFEMVQLQETAVDTAA